MPSVWQQQVMNELARISGRSVSADSVHQTLQFLVQKHVLVQHYADIVLAFYNQDIPDSDILAVLKTLTPAAP